MDIWQQNLHKINCLFKKIKVLISALVSIRRGVRLWIRVRFLELGSFLILWKFYINLFWYSVKYFSGKWYFINFSISSLLKLSLEYNFTSYDFCKLFTFYFFDLIPLVDFNHSSQHDIHIFFKRNGPNIVVNFHSL